jgi:drug/metabolite transporter (DMT)-like permease
VAAALAGALLSAGAYVMTRRLTRTNDPLVIVFYFAFFTVVCSLPFNLVHFVPPRGWDWLLVLGVGVATLEGQVLMTNALSLESAVRVMSVGYLQIVFTALLGLALLAEVPDAWSAVGAAIIILCTFRLARSHPVATPQGR